MNYSLEIDGIKIHAFRCGEVSVHYSHKNPSIGAPAILLDPRWLDWAPVWAWAIEHPEGIYVVDTGENIRFNNPDYFKGGGLNGWVNRKIVRIKIDTGEEIGEQLLKVGIDPADVQKVVMTHLHIDHTDGLHWFPNAEILVTQREWRAPYGAVPSTFPSWFRPKTITHSESHPFFDACTPLTSDGKIVLLSTPGHASGHQSVLVRTQEGNIFIAGDTTFDQEQLLKIKPAGIHQHKKRAIKTMKQIRDFSRKEQLLYLPSHDPESGRRLSEKLWLPG